MFSKLFMLDSERLNHKLKQKYRHEKRTVNPIFRRLKMITSSMDLASINMTSSRLQVHINFVRSINKYSIVDKETQHKNWQSPKRRRFS